MHLKLTLNIIAKDNIAFSNTNTHLLRHNQR